MGRKALVILMFLPFSIWSQISLSWSDLAKTTYKTLSDDRHFGLYQANFNKELLSLEGKEVVLAGFVLPMDIQQNTFALSSSPFENCFFCGNAEPNSVVELNFKKKQSKFLVDQFIIVKGILKLNRNNPNELFFKIIKVEIYG